MRPSLGVVLVLLLAAGGCDASNPENDAMGPGPTPTATPPAGRAPSAGGGELEPEHQGPAPAPAVDNVMPEHDDHGFEHDHDVLKYGEHPEGWSKSTAGNADTWDDVYSDVHTDEVWPWTTIEDAVLPLVIGAVDILNVGCGDSTLAEGMVSAGVGEQGLVNVDHSGVVIEKMKTKYPALRFEIQDALNMTFSDESFDVVLEKNTRSLFLEGLLWEESEALMKEAWRVLRWGGVLVSVTHFPLSIAAGTQHPLVWEIEHANCTDLTAEKVGLDRSGEKVVVIRKQKPAPKSEL